MRAIGGLRAITCLACALAAPVGTAPMAQTGGATGKVVSAREQGDASRSAVSLLVQPARGDVLLLHLEQSIEMSGAKRDEYLLPDVVGANGAPPTVRPPAAGPRRNVTATQVTIMNYYAHSTVESRDAKGTIIVATTDSLLVETGESGQALISQRVPIPEVNAPTRVLVASNGAMKMLDAPEIARSVGATLSAMPAMLPDTPVMVGDSWEREIEMPSLPNFVYRADGVLRARFRLDSISRSGREAYVSVRGELQHVGPGRELPVGTRVVTAGSMTGTLLLDRVRGWIVDARTTISIRSNVVAARQALAPMALDIRISQRLRVR